MTTANDANRLISIDAERCTQADEATDLEWLATDGVGGYASGTVANVPTRRYHGVLLAATDPPAGRTLLIHSVHERLHLGDRTIELDANRWADGSISPRGFEHLTRFELEGGIPTWTWAIEGIRLQRRIALDRGTVQVRWNLIDATHPVHLEYAVAVSNRSHHALLQADTCTAPTCTRTDELARIDWPTPPEGGTDRPTWIRCDGTILPRNEWWRGFDLAVEEARGFDHEEDAWHALDCTVELPATGSVSMHAGLDREAVAIGGDLIEARHDAERVILDRAGVEEAESLHGRLVLAADQFLVERPLPGGGSGATVIAGYPWFADWGRDTMIALPGLAIATGRTEEARSILETFAAHESDGLLPNLFPDDGGEPHYNTVDASLFFIRAVRAWFDATRDRPGLARLWPTVRSIVDNYTTGTRHGIGADPQDGLLHAGEAGVQLPWMDARVGDRVITPRMGKPVEINALWQSGLAAAADFARTLDEDDTPFETAHRRVARGFERFWNPDTGCLFDVLDGPDGDDPAIRPNQLLALVCDPDMLDAERARSALEVVRTRLLVPMGVRTLDPSDPGFVPVYAGGPAQRDAAYHQGTAWPWLLGPWIRACQALHPESTQEVIDDLLVDLRAHLSNAGLGSVSEILDATMPCTPRGCFAQAWSVAAMLEILGTTGAGRIPAETNGAG